jgi:RND family efflux transporter MFP subunit
MRRDRKVHRFIAISSLLVLPVLAAGCGGDEPAVRAGGQEVEGSTMVLAARTVPDQVVATGSLEAMQTVQISTRLMGWVEEVLVDAGDRVSEGQILLRIDDTDMVARKAQVEAGITEAEAVLTNAEKMASRFQKLYEQQAVSRQQLDDVLTGRDRAAAGLAKARSMRREVEVQLDYLVIRSPADGIVARKMIEPGNMASPGVPLLVIERNDPMKVIARLSQKDISRVAVGDTLRAQVTSLPEAAFAAPVARIVQAANPGSRTFDVEALLPNPDGRLKSGMFARVLVPVGQRQALVVPAGAVIERGQLQGVRILDADDVVHLRWVRLGQELAGGREVVSGLNPGDVIVVEAAEPLVEGDRVVR